MSSDFNPIGDPFGFFLWDELVDPGKPCQCPKCGRLLEDDAAEWTEKHQCYVIKCPECGTVVHVDRRGSGS